MHGVGRSRSDAGVFARGGKSQAGHGGIVAAMNDVVRDAGMVGLLLEEFVENGHRRFGVGESRIVIGA